MKFTEIEYKLTRHVMEVDSVRRASLIWECTGRTIMNRIKAYEDEHGKPFLRSLY